MELQEMLDRYEGQYVDVEYYQFNSKRHSVHTDFIKNWDCPQRDDKIDFIHSELMDEERYNESILANCSAAFTDFYNKGDKVLVVIKEGIY